jgi:Asp-tRNA(Asn)/Glu-tRNA(Gln) amidotransferase C subunit
LHHLYDNSEIQIINNNENLVKFKEEIAVKRTKRNPTFNNSEMQEKMRYDMKIHCEIKEELACKS